MSSSLTQTIQAGNGTKTQFAFNFPYISRSEIHVYFWNTTTKQWDEKLTTDSTYPWEISDANPNVVNFTSTAPPSPTAPVDPNETTEDNVKISRITNTADIRAFFNPGSAIRSSDFNNNFEQLRYAIQESNTQSINVEDQLKDYYWNNFNSTVYSTETWDSDDDQVATTQAIDARVDAKINTAITEAPAGTIDFNLVSDTTPQLGGNLDVNGNEIVSDADNENIVLNPHGTGQIDVSSSVITGVSTPTDDSHATNKSYVDTNFNNYSHPNHTGDVTSTGDGETVIADDAVTYAKMQDLGTANRVLGGTAAGQIGEVQVNTNMIADDAVTGAKLSDISGVNGSYTIAAITVDGQGRITAASSGTGSVAADSAPQLGGNLDVNSNEITSASNGNVVINPNGTGDIVLDANVGVGLTDPDEKLVVKDGNFHINNDTTGGNFSISTNVDGNGEPQIRINKARGGTGGPSQITAGDDLGDIQIRGYDGSQYAIGFKIRCTSTTNTGNFAPDTIFVNNGDTKITLRSDDNIQVHERLFSNSSLAEGQNGFDLPTSGTFKFGRNAAQATTIFQVFGADGKFQLKGDGDAQNTNNNYGGTSDSKLKENIVDANSQWDDIKAIQVRNYNYKADTPYSTHTQIGVIAQELETVCPGLVKDNIDEDKDGNDLGTVTKSVAYSVLYMKAVKALQEAMTRIETLEAKVAALESAS